MHTLQSALLLVAMFSASCSNAQSPSNTNCTTTPTGTQLGLANTRVPVPASLGPMFQIKPSFNAAHQVLQFQNFPATLSEASVATFCLEQCVVYQPNATRGPCLSFNVNLGKPVPPTGNGGPTQFFCSGFDAPIANDGSDFQTVTSPGSYQYPDSANRNRNATFRAF